MAQVNKEVVEVIDDLRNKIDILKSIEGNNDPIVTAKIDSVKQKAIEVLSQVSKKVVEMSETTADSDEVISGLQVVQKRSKDFYDDALLKIDELLNGRKPKKYDEDVLGESKDEISDFFEENVVSVTDSKSNKSKNDRTKKSSKDIRSQAISVLREWLRPEGK